MSVSWLKEIEKSGRLMIHSLNGATIAFNQKLDGSATANIGGYPEALLPELIVV